MIELPQPLPLALGEIRSFFQPASTLGSPAARVQVWGTLTPTWWSQGVGLSSAEG